MRNQDKRKYSKAPGILAALLAFLVSLAFVSDPILPPEGTVGGSIGHEIGWPVFWMNVYTPGIADSTESLLRDTSALDLLFSGNAGIVIHWPGLLVQVLLSLAIGVLVQLLVNWIRSKWGKPVDPKPEKEGFWKVMGKLVHFLKAPGWVVTIAYWVTSPFAIMSVYPSAQRPGLYEYHLGLSQWLTVLDEEAGRTAWELFFSGNAGMGIHGTGQVLAFFLGYCLMGLAWGGLIQILVNHLQDRRLDQGSQPQPHVEA